ncbi:hypothetical protein WA158_005382 [Blastocystis sp. Blastoise]
MDSYTDNQNLEMTYCRCHRNDDSLMIECTARNPKCNGWIHPSCFNISSEELEEILKMENYICPLDRDETQTDPAISMSTNSMIVEKNYDNDNYSLDTPRSSKKEKDEDYHVDNSYYNQNEEFDFDDNEFEEEDDISGDSDFEVFPSKKKSNHSVSSPTNGSRVSRTKKPNPWSDSEEEEEIPELDDDDDEEEEEEEEREEEEKEESSREYTFGLRNIDKKNYKDTDSEEENTYNYSSFSAEQSKIDKIIGRRFLPAIDPATLTPPYDPSVFEYLIKWKKQSYLHTSWVSLEEIEKDNPPHGHGRLIRFIKQLPTDYDGNTIEFPAGTKEEEFFSPNYLNVEKVLASTDAILYNLEDFWHNGCKTILNAVLKYQVEGYLLCAPFMYPVQEGKDHAPGYYSIVQQPMDFASIRRKLFRTIKMATENKHGNVDEEEKKEQELYEQLEERQLEIDAEKERNRAENKLKTKSDDVSNTNEINPVKTEITTGNIYTCYQEFDRDVTQIFINCRLYNTDLESEILTTCSQLESFYRGKMDDFIEEYNITYTIIYIYRYLIKWEDLSYADVTWENEGEIYDDMKISQFERRERIPMRKKNPLYIPGKTKLKEKNFLLPPFKENKTLRPYQVDGYRWLANNFVSNKNSILADEMGLGKTIQVISLMQYIVKVLCVGDPIIVIAPLSTLGFWKKEIESWTTLDVCLYHDTQGGKDIRKQIQEYEWYYTYNSGKHVGQHVPGLYKFDVLICTYEMILTDFEDISSIPYTLLVVDEAQRMKGQNSKLQGALKQMNWKQCVLLSGTPLQNNMTELWTLLDFVAPKVIPDLPRFLKEFGDLQNTSQVARLQTLLQGYILRRLKESVEDSIPRKEETIIDIELTTLQKAYYKAVYDHNRSFLTRGFSKDGRGNNLNINTQFRGPTLLNMEIQLRKCCNHPYLLEGTEHNETAGLSEKEIQDKLIKSSGKMVLLDKLLFKLKQEGHRVLIFSQFTGMLDIIERYLRYKEFNFERIDGSVRGNAREKAIQHFNEEGSEVFVFLLSTRAGGVGITLTSADTVIIFDSDWNPQNDVQAQARCHRIGQKKSVRIYRLITKNTYETIMFEKASRKLGLEQAVMASNSKKTSQDDLEVLLKMGAYAQALQDNELEDENAKTFCEANIDELLEKQSRVVHYESSSNSPIFSKTSFVSTSSDTKLDINDPNFWNKVFGVDKRDTILNRLEDGTVLKTEETKEAFIAELHTMGEEMVNMKLNGEQLPTWCDILGGVLKQMINMKLQFTDEQRKRCLKLLSEIDKPRRRRRTVMQQVSDSVFEDDAEKEERTEKSTQHSDDVCYVCLRGNTEDEALIGCRGSCSRCFHPSCLSDPPNPRDYNTWKCDTCEYKHHICITCHKEGYDKDTEEWEKDSHYSALTPDASSISPTAVKEETNEIEQSERDSSKDIDLKKDTDSHGNNDIKVENGSCVSPKDEEMNETVANQNEDPQLLYKCSMRNCYRYYHLECVMPHPLTNRSHFTDLTRFRCPAHYCLVCKETGNNKLILNCVWCENSIHASCFVPNKHGIRLSRKYYLCHNHQIPKGIKAWKPLNQKKKLNDDTEVHSRATPLHTGGSTRILRSSRSKHSNRRYDDDDDDEEYNVKSKITAGASTREISRRNIKRRSWIEETKEDDKDKEEENKQKKKEKEKEMLKPLKRTIVTKKVVGKSASDIINKNINNSNDKNSRGSSLSLRDKARDEEDHSSDADSVDNNERELKAGHGSLKRLRNEEEEEKDEEEKKEYYIDKKGVIQYYTSWGKYTGNWCRYCGAREPCKFMRGPWGNACLCVVHFVDLKEKRLDLSKWIKTNLKKPIAPEKNTLLKYLEYKKKKLRKETNN